MSLDYQVDVSGVLRRLGCLLPPEGFVSAFPVFEKEIPLLEPADIERIAKSGDADGRSKFDATWIQDQKSHGSCFPPGTLIRMADGSQKPIEQIRLLDDVLTAEGNTRRVMKVMVRPHAGKIHRLKIWGHRHLRATTEHPILTKRGYVAVDSLRAGDWIAVPKYLPQKVDSIVPSEFVVVASKSAQRKTLAHGTSSYTTNLPGKPPVTVERTPLPELIPLNATFGRLVGLFLAEGSLSHGRVTFTFGSHEVDTFAAEVVGIFRDLFGVKANVCANRGNKRTCDVKVYGTGWAKLFEELCKTGSGNKGLHPQLASGPEAFLLAVLQGWQDGDGLGEKDRNGGVTVSHELAMNMYDIACAAGFKPTVETLHVKINPRHGIKSRRLRYIVAWPKGSGEHPWKRVEQDEKAVWRLLDSVETEPFSGFVYNLEVEGDHSYVAESIGVHNCNGFAGAMALSRARVRRGLPRVTLSGAYLYSLVNGGRDQGSALDDGMRAMQEKGVATQETVGWNAIYPSQYDRAKADAEAERFKAFECYAVGTLQGLWSALALDFDCVVAVHAGNRFMQVDGHGVAGVDSGPGNHAVLCDGLAFEGGEVVGTGANSWNLSYGVNGRMCLRKAHFAQTMQHHTLYALRSTSDDPRGNNPPVAH